ncbi:hypothetical protein H0X06_05550 [Candidatus Dependentiae bacterium]|nr:hypothetical protein [Candidatus Dependentiae bacterium]
MAGFLLFFVSSFCSSTPWAFYLVVQADGFLHESAQKTIENLEKACAAAPYETVHGVIDLFEGTQFKRYFLDQKGMRIVDHSIFHNSISSTMKKGALYAFEGYPHYRTMVIFSGHGSGSMEPHDFPLGEKRKLFQIKTESYYSRYCKRKNLFLADLVYNAMTQSTQDTKSLFFNNSFCLLSSTSLCQFLDSVSQNILNGRKIDIVGFDACHMATLEIADELVDCAQYMIASQEAEYKNGWDYTALIESLLLCPESYSVSRRIVYTYEAQQRKKEGISYSLSALDLDSIKRFRAVFNKVATHTALCMSSSSLFHDTVCEVRLKVEQDFLGHSCVDLLSYYEELLAEIECVPHTDHVECLKVALIEALVLLNQAIIASVSLRERAFVKGCSIYFPKSYDSSLYTCSFSSRSLWTSFLMAFNGSLSV